MTSNSDHDFGHRPEPMLNANKNKKNEKRAWEGSQTISQKNSMG